MNQQPLKGVRVLDLTHGLAGPYGMQFMALFGAEVIKLESRTRPDRFRGASRGEDLDAARGFAEANRAKRSVTINMKTSQGRALAQQLAALSDVVAENYSLGVLERWGLEYHRLRKVNPGLVMVSMQGMGRRGPNKHWVTWGASLLAYSGIDWMWGYPDQDRPVGSQIAHPDYIAGIMATTAVLAALDRRRRSGIGQYIELPQVLGAASLLPTTLLDYFMNERVSPRRGNQHPSFAPYGVYPCAGDDRWCVIAATSEDEWLGFCRALGNPEWARDERFQTMASRVEHRQDLDPLVQGWTSQRTPHEVMHTLQAHRVPAGAVQDGRDLRADPHLRERGMIVQVEHPKLPGLEYPNNPIRLGGKPATAWRHAPLLGQDNGFVLHDVMGMDEGEIERLAGDGVLI